MTEDDNKKERINVKIDTTRTEALARENERLKMEREQKEDEEPELSLADLKLQAYQKFKQPFFLDAPDKATLSAMITNFINEVSERSNQNKEHAGSVGLSNAQFGIKDEPLFTRKFYDSQNMIDELRKLQHNGNPAQKAEAETYIQEIFKKFILDKRSNPTRPENSMNSNSPEALSDLDLVKKDGFLTPRNPEDGDLGKLQKQWREERKRRTENQQ
jgi:hypothetical protein